MKCVKFAFLALAATLFAVGAYAQATGTIEGKIVDETRASLPGVSVEVSSPFIKAMFATSDPDGAFRLDMLPPGKYFVKFTLENFATQEQTDVVVGAGRVVTLQVQMRSAFKEAVVVTGSLIPRPTLEAMSPVTTQDVEALSYRGVQRLEDLMTSLPQVYVSTNNTSTSNAASGTATVSLRNLGTSRTLVLIDGKRIQAGDSYDVAPDLNFIPTSLIKRVDILTGGASSTYGADAVAGVVNFILDTDFEGFKGGISGGGYEHNNDNSYWQAQNAASGYPYPKGSTWDGGNLDANIAYGGKFADGKGHASMYLDYRKTAQLLKGARDYYNCSAGPGDTGPGCGGSSTAATGRFTVYDPTFSTKLGNYTLGPNDTLVPFTAANYFNYGAYNSMQRPDVRWTGGGFINYDWNEHFKGYLSVMMMSDNTEAQIAPSGDFYGRTTELNCNNPMLSAQELSVLCPASAGYGPTDIANVIIGRRNVEGGPRIDDLTHEAFRLVAGLKGEINKEWSYDVYGLTAQTRVSENYLNDVNIAHAQDALLVTGTPGDPSTWQCMSGDAGCVPWNIFQTGGAGVTKAALDYIKVTLETQQMLQTQVVSGKVTGDLKDYGLAFPSASEGFQLALGAEYRKELLQLKPDQAYQDWLGAGQGGPILPVSGDYSVKEAFTELLIPIIQDARGAKDLSLSAAYRYSDYNINGSHPNYKVEADWAPVAAFKLRAGFNRATRAPNVVELFTQQSVGLSSTASTDPCAGPTPAYSPAQCARTGVTAAQYGNVPENPANQYNAMMGGNPNLNPETANTTTFGLVITPSGTGLTVAFDYYDIKLDNTIGSLGADAILNTCAQTGNPALCALIHRDHLGSLWILPTGYTITTNQNIGKLRAKGVDANLTYALPIGGSLLNFNLIGGYMLKNETNNGLYSYDCKGYYGNTCGTPVPEWRHLFRVSWETGPVTLNLNWRRIGGVTADVGSPNPSLSSPADVAQYKIDGDYHIPAFNYIDLAVSLKLRAGLQLMLGVNNIADKEPPVLADASLEGMAAGEYGTYDTGGRYVFGSVQFSF